MEEGLIYGHNPQQRVVGIQPINENKMRIYVRKNNSIAHLDLNFYPFFYLTDLKYIETYKRKHYRKRLEGDNYFKYIVAFEKWADMWNCINKIIDNYNKERPIKTSSFEELPIIILIPDRIIQFLMQSGITYYKGMEFNEIHRLQISLGNFVSGTLRNYDPRRESDKIRYIALSDNRGYEEILGLKEKSEKKILQKLERIIQALNPDIIEGINLHDDILYPIQIRCELNGLNFQIGRDNSNLKLAEYPLYSKYKSQKNTYTVAGRNLIDLSDILQEYDPTKRLLQSYNFKTIAEYFKYELNTIYDDTTTQEQMCLEQNRLTQHISNILLPSYVIQAKIFPLYLEKIIDTPPSQKIEYLFLREYLRNKTSIPFPQPTKQISGGYTDIFYIGVFDNVYYIDVESMYPSIILTQNINPVSDNLNIFIKSLKYLTDIRIHSKKEYLEDRTKKHLLHTQENFKSLTNTYYGYLAYHKGLFNDYNKANMVSELGQEILKKIIYHIQSQNGTVIEVDTDGVFFIPPYKADNEEDVQKLIREINNYLPSETHLILGGKYKKFLSYKKKNYALLRYDDKIQIKGSALIARNIEKFGITFIQDCIRCILKEEFYELHHIYKELYYNILNHKWNIQDFVRVEILKDSLYRYTNEIKKDQRNKNAAYELALKSDRSWNIGDKIAYYITGNEANVKTYENCKYAEEWDPNFPDENTSYYLKRLEEFTKKFAIYFSAVDFNKIFSLNDYKKEIFKTIRILTTKVSKDTTTEIDEKDEFEYKIWLADE